MCYNYIRIIVIIMKKIYIKDDEKTHLSKFFDIVVIDEAHSMVTDATYCDASFYMFQFMEALYRQSEVKIILMTATYNPIKNLFDRTGYDDFAFWDFTDTCKRMRPKEIFFIQKELALRKLSKFYNENPEANYRCVYFATKTEDIKNYIVPFLIRKGIPEEKIAVSFSNEESLEGFSETLISNKRRTEMYLSEHEDLPIDIKVFVTTSKNKEGININNDKYIWDIFIESHWKDEIEQMWGRVRTNLNQTFLIYDAVQHHSINLENDYDYEFNNKTIKEVNESFDDWCKKRGISLINRMHNERAQNEIERLQEDRFPYLRYSPFSESFELYRGKILGKHQFHCSKIDYNSCLFRGYVNGTYGEELFGIPAFLVVDDSKEERFENYLKENGHLERCISKKDKDNILDFITNELDVYKKSGKKLEPYKDLSKALRGFGYKLRECSKNKSNKLYGYYVLEKL